MADNQTLNYVFTRILIGLSRMRCSGIVTDIGANTRIGEPTSMSPCVSWVHFCKKMPWEGINPTLPSSPLMLKIAVILGAVNTGGNDLREVKHRIRNRSHAT